MSPSLLELFAYDNMLYRLIYCPTDYSLLQTDIDDICSWTSDNLLEFSVQKCKYMIISHKKQLQPLDQVSTTFLSMINILRNGRHVFTYVNTCRENRLLTQSLALMHPATTTQ